jgi:hypothetical protein
MNEALPIGSIIAWSTAIPPAKWLPMVGQDITEYEELVSVIGTNKLPDTRKRVLWGDTIPLNTIEAGLPNIEGTVGGSLGFFASANGAFSATSASKDWNGTGGKTAKNTFDFNASRSNSIYGNSDTVQPPAITVVWIIKYE